MIDPPPAACMPGITALIAKKQALRLMAIDQSQKASSASSVLCRWSFAALLTSKVMGPLAAAAPASVCRRADKSVMSHAKKQRSVAGRRCHLITKCRSVRALAEGDFGSLAQEAFGQGRADASAATGDEDRLTLEFGIDRRAVHVQRSFETRLARTAAQRAAHSMPKPVGARQGARSWTSNPAWAAKMRLP
jgi:hypothetical protein